MTNIIAKRRLRAIEHTKTSPELKSNELKKKENKINLLKKYLQITNKWYTKTKVNTTKNAKTIRLISP